MGRQSCRSTESALEVLTEQVHTVWGQGSDKVATLMSMDVAGAFDTVSHQRLIHNLQKQKISKWIADWVKSFLTERKTRLSIYRQTTKYQVQMGIPQRSFLSFILYLFYNANLLEICNRPGTNTSAMGFIDDVNVLVYSTSTEENCKILERLHKECKRWAVKHGSVFAPDKYKLIHLAKNSKNLDMTTTINISSEIIKPKADIRVLGLQINCKLKWSAHIQWVQEKMASQTLALTKLIAST